MDKPLEITKKDVGLSPGTLLYLHEKKIDQVVITYTSYNSEELNQREVKSADECFPFNEKNTVNWIDVCGLHDTSVIAKIGNNLGLHPLTQEDILNIDHRPKIEESDKYLFCALKMVSYAPDDSSLDIEHVSLILGPNYLLTFQEKPGDQFAPVRERLKNPQGRLRKMKPDYLFYALIDVIVDDYFVFVEKLDERMELLEDDLVANPSSSHLQEIYKLKRELILLRKSIWPLREIISMLQKTDSPLVCDSTSIYLRDLYDHVIQIIDTLEVIREMVTGMLDIYLSSISYKMNDVMKVLTVFAVIFIPLTFFAGIYGMNFDYMPELRLRWGYFALWGFLITITVVMLIFFRKKKYI